MNQKSHFYLLQAACWNAPKWMLRKSSLMAIPKRTLSRLGCPWTSPPSIRPFSSLLSRSSEESPWHFASFILYPGNTNYAQGLSSNLQPDMGWAAVAIRGAPRKSFHVILHSEHVPWVWEVPDVLCVLQPLQPPLVCSSGRLHHQPCLQLTASLDWRPFTCQSWRGVFRSWLHVNETNIWDTETHAGSALSALESFPQLSLL